MKITYLDINCNTSDLDNTTNLKNMKHINPKSYQLDKNYNNDCFDLDNLFKPTPINDFNTGYSQVFHFDVASIIIQFDKIQKIRGLFLLSYSNYGIHISIYGSNDNVNYTLLDTGTTINDFITAEIILADKKKYKYYKLVLTKAWNQCHIRIWLYTNLIDKYCIKNNDGYYNIINNKKVESNIKENTNMIDSLPNNKINSDIKIIKVSKEYKIV